jgi:hypothetical protein
LLSHDPTRSGFCCHCGARKTLTLVEPIPRLQR